MDPFNHFTNSAVESYRRTQELAAGGVIATQMRRMHEIASGGAMGHQMQNLKDSERWSYGTAVRAVDGCWHYWTAKVPWCRDRIAGLTGRSLGTTDTHAIPRHRTVPRNSRGDARAAEAASAPQPVTEDRPIDRSFILKQMIEAKDEEAQAACCRYILRNGLLES